MTDVIVKKLIATHTTIATMESCTAGLLASMITDVEGASEIFFGGFVTYSNDAKIKAGVQESVIIEYGVYSKECAIAMAKAAQGAFHTDIGIGITGTTGNIDPNNADSIEGSVDYCIRIGEQEYIYHLNLNVKHMNRHEIKYAYAVDVFKKLEQLV